MQWKAIMRGRTSVSHAPLYHHHQLKAAAAWIPQAAAVFSLSLLPQAAHGPAAGSSSFAYFRSRSYERKEREIKQAQVFPLLCLHQDFLPLSFSLARVRSLARPFSGYPGLETQRDQFRLCRLFTYYNGRLLPATTGRVYLSHRDYYTALSHHKDYSSGYFSVGT